MRLTDWTQRGYADHRDSTPYRRAPDLPSEELTMNVYQAKPEVNAYWDGYYASNADTIREEKST